MLISVWHSMAILSLQTHIINWRKLKKIVGKYILKKITWNKILQKNHLALANTNRVSRYTFSVLKLCYSQRKYKHSPKKMLSPHCFSHVFKK